jgi:hypothetical protein
MAAFTSGSRSDQLPVAPRPLLAYVASLVIALVLTVASLAGLFFPNQLYPSADLRMVRLPLDLFTLFVALPLLLGSMRSTHRGHLVGLLCWPGVLLYVLYVSITHLVGVPFSAQFPAYLLLAPLSAYTVVGLVVSIDRQAVQQRLSGAVPARVVGGLLTGLTGLFILMNLADIASALITQTPAGAPSVAAWVGDFAVIPACLAGGILLWRRHALGYVAAPGLLLLYSLLFLGLIPVMVHSAWATGSPVDLAGVIMMSALAVVCLVALAFSVRGRAGDVGPPPT